jgi:iron-sulfur cluster assembly protein
MNEEKMVPESSTADINLTEKAALEIKKIMKENKIPDDYGLRVGVKGGGCSGMSYTIGFEQEPKDGDTVFAQRDVKLFIDGKSLFYLNGIELDYTGGLNGKGFTFNNPNAAKTCGCGNSFGV